MMTTTSKRRIWVLGLFPEFFSPLTTLGITGQVFQGQRGAGLQLIHVHLRDYTDDTHKSVDDTPYGGGPGMVMRADILTRALKEGVLTKSGKADLKSSFHVIATDPRGEVFTHTKARSLALNYLDSQSEKELVFICGRYEGIDERFLEEYVDECLSVGDFVLTGGEIAAMAFIDALVRFTPHALGNRLSANEDSFEDGLLEHPQYTRPKVFEGRSVPDVLLSGHHEKIEAWRSEQKRAITKRFRPDLWERLKKDKC
jgi:tRNA (guanine37-N1)-methyltransferase